MSRIPALEASLRDAAARIERRESNAGPRRTGRRMRIPTRSLVLAALLLIVITATAAAGTLIALRGTVIPGPSPRDVPPEQSPVPDSAKLAPIRSKDPAGAPPWTLRIARSKTGFTCSTVGQVKGGQFGIVGLDGTFRRLAVGVVDGCGVERADASTLVGARVLDADQARDVRTIVNGVGGPDLRAVTVETIDGPKRIPVTDQGVFIAAFRGYPEDLAVRVTLRFADGHVEDHPFGASRFVVPDPAGGRAWKIDMYGMGRPTSAACQKAFSRGRPCQPDRSPVKNCLRFKPARETRNPSMSSLVCGYTRFIGAGREMHVAGYFFGVRREPHGTAATASWRKHPRRTAVIGMAGEEVARIKVEGPEGTRRAGIDERRVFLLLYGPQVRPGQLTVKVTMRDGRTRVYKGDTNVVKGDLRP